MERLGVSPKLLEFVEFPSLSAENVNGDVARVDQPPVGAVLPLEPDRQAPASQVLLWTSEFPVARTNTSASVPASPRSKTTTSCAFLSDRAEQTSS